MVAEEEAVVVKGETSKAEEEEIEGLRMSS